MKALFLYLWQLPQNLLGLLVIAVFRCRQIVYLCTPPYYRTKKDFAKIGAVSLGEYRIMFCTPSRNTVLHEYGHTQQSRRLGWLYLPVIGLPSLCGNIYDRLFHRRWSAERRRAWYYSQPWEAWADKLGGVARLR